MMIDCDPEISGELFCGVVLADAKQGGGEVDHIAVCLTAEAMKASIELHAWRPVIVERTLSHTVSAALDAVMLRRPSGRDGGFDRFKIVHGKTPFCDIRIRGSVV